MLNWIDDELSRLEDQGLRRRIQTTDQRPRVNLSSNDYLGLSRHPELIEAAQQAAARWGTGAGSARLLSGTTPLHAELEKGLARFVGREAALVFPSGYMANLGIVTSLVGPGDAVILDRYCHASLIDAARLSGARLLVYHHASPEDAEKALRRARTFRRRLLMTESLFSMDGDFAPLAELSALCRRYESMSLVDEAHALGVWGTGGRGMAATAHRSVGASEDTPEAPTLPRSDASFDVVVGTLSKTFGSQGGFVAGSAGLRDWVINRARPFLFTTGLSPVCAAAALAGLRLAESMDEERAMLIHRSRALAATLRASGWDVMQSQSQILPIRLGSAQAALRLAARLAEAGYDVPAIRPPTVPAGECRIRISLTALLNQQTLDDFAGRLSPSGATA